MNSAVIILISDWVDRDIAKPQQTRKKYNEMRHPGNPTPPKKITIFINTSLQSIPISVTINGKYKHAPYNRMTYIPSFHFHYVRFYLHEFYRNNTHKS